MDIRIREYINADKELMRKTWNDFYQCIENKKIIVFGASSGAVHLMKEKTLDIAYFVDNAQAKWNQTLNGTPVYSPERIKEENMDHIVVLIASVYISSIAKQLKELGVKHIFARRFQDYDSMIIREQDMQEANSVLDLLYDQRSKEICKSIIQKRINKEMDYSDLAKEVSQQYFDDEIVSCQINESFVDAGAFDGATSVEFAKWAKKGYEKIVIYEPMKENIVNVEHTVRNLKNVEIHNKALWNKKELLQFSFDGAGSSIDKNGITVEAEPLDPDSKVTFVKMDIEGAEMNALEGMKSIIMEQKPKLAICIYHLYDDLWNIPKYIHELVPEYKLYMRHYSKINEETVIYAIL